MRYQVRFVSDEALPEVDWAFARVGATTYLFVRQSAVDVHTGECDVLTRAWETWQRVDPAIPLVPGQRVQSIELEKAAG